MECNVAYVLFLVDSFPFTPGATFVGFLAALSGFIGFSIAGVGNEDVEVFEDAMVSGVGVSLVHPYP